MIYFDVSVTPLANCFKVEIEKTPHYQQQILIFLENKKKYLTNNLAAYIYYIKDIQERRQKILESDNFMLVRNYAIDSQKGRKLEAK